MATTTNYYGLSKPSYNEVADIEVINANMDKIDTQMKNNSDGVNFAKGISSDAYDNSRPYAVGDYCIYDNKLYRCITAIESAEAFNVEKWEQTTVGNEINQLNSNLRPTELITDGLVLGEYTNNIFSGYGYYRFGNIVIVNFAIGFNTSTTPDSFIAISGLPRPLAAVCIATNYGGIVGTISQSGELSLYHNTTGLSIIASGVYITK